MVRWSLIITELPVDFCTRFTIDDETVTTIGMRCESAYTSPSVELSIPSATGLVTGITVTYAHRDFTKEECTLLISDSEPIRTYHWQVLDECAQAFGDSLERVSVRIRTDEETLRHLSDVVNTNMPLMRQSGRLRLCFAEPAVGYRWEDDVIIDLWKFEWKRLIL